MLCDEMAGLIRHRHLHLAIGVAGKQHTALAMAATIGTSAAAIQGMHMNGKGDTHEALRRG